MTPSSAPPLSVLLLLLRVSVTIRLTYVGWAHVTSPLMLGEYCMQCFKAAMFVSFPFSFANCSQGPPSTSVAWLLCLGLSCMEIYSAWLQLQESYSLYMLPALFVAAFMCLFVALCGSFEEASEEDKLELEERVDGLFSHRDKPTTGVEATDGWFRLSASCVSS